MLAEPDAVPPPAVTREQVAHLAGLARIELRPEQLAPLAEQLGQILGAVAQVAEVAAADVPATSHPLPLRNVLREDVVGPSLTPAEALSGAPDPVDGRFRVPRILDED